MGQTFTVDAATGLTKSANMAARDTTNAVSAAHAASRKEDERLTLPQQLLIVDAARAQIKSSLEALDALTATLSLLESVPMAQAAQVKSMASIFTGVFMAATRAEKACKQ